MAIAPNMEKSEPLWKLVYPLERQVEQTSVTLLQVKITQVGMKGRRAQDEEVASEEYSSTENLMNQTNKTSM